MTPLAALRLAYGPGEAMPGWPLWTLTVAAMLLPIPHVAFKLIDKRRGR